MSITVNRQMQIAAPGAGFTLVELPVHEPGVNQVRVTVEACGVCTHSDMLVGAGHFPGVTFPVVLGHEIAGRVDAVGPGVTGWSVGDRVAVGWYGGSCGHCDACRTGEGIYCEELQVPSVSYPGGYADSVVVPVTTLAAIPDELTAAEAAPLACAGVTVFNALRRSAARPGDTVAILGLGGLGHLGVQFAAKMGFRTVAIARGDKAELARQLGASHYIDSTTADVAKELQALGGAKVVLSTVSSAAAAAATIDGLGLHGELVLAGLSMEKVEASLFQLGHGGKRVYGHFSGISIDTQDTLRFAAQTGVRAWTEQAPLEEAGSAFARATSGDVRFRMVLTTGN
ncbi:alcohol dehydrogenase catalytic domain-containing protein [Nonomuraea aridisoli]|uniref:Alcohol dehydrogenase n=1 Tax=Nonomuraea aridisoli TaxID=2070368 RepID=A0A2W2FB40_9ACTN|nr:alcohol dehydrogenase catalytic domain-containing protein [Nonomuraea aridisoli]PZG18797.1 alcohol dehydrogenase [Nonomuraea aridisoli]